MCSHEFSVLQVIGHGVAGRVVGEVRRLRLHANADGAGASWPGITLGEALTSLLHYTKTSTGNINNSQWYKLVQNKSHTNTSSSLWCCMCLTKNIQQLQPPQQWNIGCLCMKCVVTLCMFEVPEIASLYLCMLSRL